MGNPAVYQLILRCGVIAHVIARHAEMIPKRLVPLTRSPSAIHSFFLRSTGSCNQLFLHKKWVLRCCLFYSFFTFILLHYFFAFFHIFESSCHASLESSLNWTMQIIVFFPQGLSSPRFQASPCFFMVLVLLRILFCPVTCANDQNTCFVEFVHNLCNAHIWLDQDIQPTVLKAICFDFSVFSCFQDVLHTEQFPSKVTFALSAKNMENCTILVDYKLQIL